MNHLTSEVPVSFPPPPISLIHTGRVFGPNWVVLCVDTPNGQLGKSFCHNVGIHKGCDANNAASKWGQTQFFALWIYTKLLLGASWVALLLVCMRPTPATFASAGQTCPPVARKFHCLCAACSRFHVCCPFTFQTPVFVQWKGWSKSYHLCKPTDFCCPAACSSSCFSLLVFSKSLTRYNFFFHEPSSQAKVFLRPSTFQHRNARKFKGKMTLLAPKPRKSPNPQSALA